MQEVMDKGIDGYEIGADLEPDLATTVGAQEQRRQRHRQHFLAYAVHLPQRVYQGLAQPSNAIRAFGTRIAQPLIDPADEIPLRNVAYEQEQAVCGLVEATVAQSVARQRACRKVGFLIAQSGGLRVAAVVEQPITAELGAGGTQC